MERDDGDQATGQAAEATGNDVEAKVVDSALEEAKAEKLAMVEAALQFLMDKGVHEEFAYGFESAFDAMRCPTTEAHEKAQSRLLRIYGADGVDSKDTVGDEVPQDVESWAQFTAKAEVWSDPDTSFVFHRDHPQVCREHQPPCLVQRVQKSSLCYLHGADVLQHYLVAMGTDTPEKPVGMIDLTAMVRNRFDAERLRRHIFEDRGGVSIQALRSMLQPRSVTFSKQPTEVTRDLLLEHGPALVSTFQVYPHFYDPGCWQYTGMPEGEKDGGHAMVLIGVREHDDGTSRFLLQNWWEKSQFVEVCPDYLEGCLAQVTFVRTAQTCIPLDMHVSLAFYAETESIDQEDRLPSDGPQ